VEVCCVQSATRDMLTSKSESIYHHQSLRYHIFFFFFLFNYTIKLYMNIHACCTENKCLFFVCKSGLRSVRNYTVGGFSSGEIHPFCYTGKIK